MAKKEKAKYILSPNAKGQVWAPKPLFDRADGGKFDLEKPLTQEDLEYLCENKYTDMVIKIEA